MKYEFGICGPLDFEEKHTGGQSIKTREFYYALAEEVGPDKILLLESISYKKNIIEFIYRFIYMCVRCKNVLLFPAQNGIVVFSYIIPFIKRFTKTRFLYNVIGGWLPEMLKDKPKMVNRLLSFDHIFVETKVMNNILLNFNLKNVVLLKNFKRIKAVSSSTINLTTCPVRLCYFSRVMKEKGIEDAVTVVKKINSKDIRCVLDIYGPVVDSYSDDFQKLKEKFTKEICYKGTIAPEKSVMVIKNYDIQLFPTLYKTEGIPGSILDSFFAGVPVLAAKWNSFSDVITEGITGEGFELGNKDDFEKQLERLIDNKMHVNDMKINCLSESDSYSAKQVIKRFLTILEEHD